MNLIRQLDRGKITNSDIVNFISNHLYSSICILRIKTSLGKNKNMFKNNSLNSYLLKRSLEHQEINVQTTFQVQEVGLLLKIKL